jgi:hypothetical protein
MPGSRPGPGATAIFLCVVEVPLYVQHWPSASGAATHCQSMLSLPVIACRPGKCCIPTDRAAQSDSPVTPPVLDQSVRIKHDPEHTWWKG